MAMLPVMGSRTLLPLRMSRVIRFWLLIPGVLSVPNVGLAALQRPHCNQHERSSMHQPADAGDRHQATKPIASASWKNGTQHNCPHCPATECARIAPCTTSSSAAVLEASPAVSDPVSNRVRARRVLVHPYSATHQPPTPPPQLIS